MEDEISSYGKTQMSGSASYHILNAEAGYENNQVADSHRYESQRNTHEGQC